MQSEDGSGVTNSNTVYDENLYKSMNDFWDLFSTGLSTTTVTCATCGNNSNTRKPFIELMLNFPEVHHEGDQDFTVQDLIKHYCATQHLPDYECNVCKVRGLANKVTVITECPSILCAVLCRKKMNGESIKSNVLFPISGIKIAEDDLCYNLVVIGTVHHFPRTTDNGHYMSIFPKSMIKIKNLVQL